MSGTIRAAASALQAHQLRLDVAAHNIANMNTSGFKASRTDLQDNRYLPQADTQAWVGTGVLASSRSVFAQGPLLQTGIPKDVAILGPGFFPVRLPDGGAAYTRQGNLEVNGEGTLVALGQYPLEPSIQVPQDATGLVIDEQGRVSARLAGRTERVELGVLRLAEFANPSGLRPLGNGLFGESETSGAAVPAALGEGARSKLASGALEASTVDLSQEMVSMLEAQRAYQLSARTFLALLDLTQQAMHLDRQ